MYFAARVQQEAPEIGTRHGVNIDAATLDQMFPQALDDYAEQMDRVAEFSGASGTPCQ